MTPKNLDDYFLEYQKYKEGNYKFGNYQKGTQILEDFLKGKTFVLKAQILGQILKIYNLNN